MGTEWSEGGVYKKRCRKIFATQLNTHRAVVLSGETHAPFPLSLPDYFYRGLPSSSLSFRSHREILFAAKQLCCSRILLSLLPSPLSFTTKKITLPATMLQNDTNGAQPTPSLGDPQPPSAPKKKRVIVPLTKLPDRRAYAGATRAAAKEDAHAGRVRRPTVQDGDVRNDKRSKGAKGNDIATLTSAEALSFLPEANQKGGNGKRRRKRGKGKGKGKGQPARASQAEVAAKGRTENPPNGAPDDAATAKHLAESNEAAAAWAREWLPKRPEPETEPKGGQQASAMSEEERLARRNELLKKSQQKRRGIVRMRTGEIRNDEEMGGLSKAQCKKIGKALAAHGLTPASMKEGKLDGAACATVLKVMQETGALETVLESERQKGTLDGMEAFSGIAPRKTNEEGFYPDRVEEGATEKEEAEGDAEGGVAVGSSATKRKRRNAKRKYRAK